MRNIIRNTIRNTIRNLAGIFCVFALVAAVVVLLSIAGNREGTRGVFLGFDGFSPLSVQPQQEIITKKFRWRYPREEKRETEFEIDRAILDDEIKRFGQRRGMNDSMFLKRRGFKIVGRRNYMVNRQVMERVFTIVDYKQIFERNLEYFPPLTQSLMQSAQLKKDTGFVRPFLNFIQYIPFKRPPERYGRLFIGNFFVPMVCLYEGYGDCDSKCILLAEFLATYPGSDKKLAMVLVRGNGIAHAVLGIKGKPLPGVTKLFFPRKGYFIVLEVTRPGWAPGFTDRRIIDALKAGLFRFEELN